MPAMWKYTLEMPAEAAANFFGVTGVPRRPGITIAGGNHARIGAG